MQVLQTYHDVLWLPQPNKISEVLSSDLPPMEQITTVFGLITYKKQILLANLYRGWDLPGGHVEEGESLEETLVREVYEETKVIVEKPALIGYQQMEVLAEKPNEYRYPYPVSYQVHYHAKVRKICDFTGDQETTGRGFFTYEQVKGLENLQLRLGLISHILEKIV
ncbi:NUDIX domain-containing protein [Shimazuella alba]|uniref:NUDIX domain-containing protein n=1 Tax=Shimazuella alba TaxID=2690964 RepID=A0A6I4W0M8_9BACL|nr:NUDIX domain-containing protein [Shimazuella alba]MXQ55755.1 NUDIX domain-containing protein [Shimazuella alba]